MEEQPKSNLYGLVGSGISYSFSKGYFTEKFKREGLSYHFYQNFDLSRVEQVEEVFKKNNLKGLNVTIPYKEEIIPYLDELHSTAKEIQAVNTVRLYQGRKIGFNTDVIGFEESLKPLLNSKHKRVLILGTGGASKAIQFVFEKLNIPVLKVSRESFENVISYKEVNKSIIEDHQIIVNCTPLGTHPNIDQCPDIPYEFINPSHLCYDLIYNPNETSFLKRGKQRGATVKNGLEMLQLQAEASWKIWNSSSN